jgi:hypothetical protein
MEVNIGGIWYLCIGIVGLISGNDCGSPQDRTDAEIRNGVIGRLWWVMIVQSIWFIVFFLIGVFRKD